MTTVASTATSLPTSPLVNFIIEAYVDAMRPNYVLLTLASVFTALLVPLFIMLFVFSTPRMRTRAMFICAAFDVFLGLAFGVWTMKRHLSIILSPTSRALSTLNYVFVWPLIFSLIPWIVDLTLLLRVLAVYPWRTTPRLLFAAIFAFPILIKAARLGACITGFTIWRSLLSHDESVLKTAYWLLRSKWTKIEWTLRLFDNGYTTVIFLYKLRSSILGTATSSSIIGKVKILFWIALTNFIFPFILDIIQIAAIIAKATSFTSSYLLMVNIYVAIAGVVFATVWVNGIQSDEERSYLPRTISTAFRSNAPIDSGIMLTTRIYGSASEMSTHECRSDRSICDKEPDP